MASQINDSGKNAALNALGALCTHMALYSDVGGTTELTGGSYARKSISFAAASGGSKAVTGSVVFDVPAGGTVLSVGFLTAITGGVQHAIDDVTQETFTSAGTYTVTSATIAIS